MIVQPLCCSSDGARRSIMLSQRLGLTTLVRDFQALRVFAICFAKANLVIGEAVGGIERLPTSSNCLL